MDQDTYDHIAQLQGACDAAQRDLAESRRENRELTQQSRDTESEIQEKDKEIEAAKKNGIEPVEHIVGYDALSVFLHKDNPLKEATIEQLGKIYKEYRLPGNYHHDQVEMEDGNLLVMTQDFHRDTVEDMCALLDRETGKILKEWDYKTFLPQDVAGSGSQDAHDWFHNNSIYPCPLSPNNTRKDPRSRSAD